LDLFRNPASRDKIFVEVRLEDGNPHLFLVDTGSSLTAISSTVAVEANLPIAPRPGQIVGIGGSTRWMGSILPTFKIGPYVLSDLPVAVGVPGIPTHVGMVPLAGIIGNDVLGQFQTIVDYPGNRLELSRPGVVSAPAHATAMFFNGQHPIVQTTLTARNSSGVTVEQSALLEVDTGARGLMIMGGSDTKLSTVASEGLEPVTGVGADRSLPNSSLFRDTRRVAISRFTIGGQVMEGNYQAIWLDYKRPRRQHAPGMPGLAGYQVLKKHRVLLDYPARKLALMEAIDVRPPTDVHEWFLRRSGVAQDSIERVKALFILGRKEDGLRKLQKLARNPTKNPGAVAMLSRSHRADGQSALAHELLGSLGVRDLVEQGEIIAWVNGLWLLGDKTKAVEQANLATVLAPTSSASWISLADASLATGDPNRARIAVIEAIRLDGHPDGHLMRRAFIAASDGDMDGAMTHLRRAIQINPAVGYAHWLYSTLASDSERLDLVKHDLLNAEQRLHPGDGPLDFLAGAWTILNDSERAEKHLNDGLARDCSKAADKASQQNCTAWYQGLVKQNLVLANQLVKEALTQRPNRAEYLDTLAVVLEAQGETVAARDAAWRAATQMPDDVYLLTQALRLNASNPEN